MTFWRIVAPLLKPALAGAILLLFVGFSRAVSTTILFVGPGTELLSVTLFSYSQAGRFEVVSALAMVLMVINVAGLVIARRWGRSAIVRGSDHGRSGMVLRWLQGFSIGDCWFGGCTPPMAATPTAAPAAQRGPRTRRRRRPAKPGRHRWRRDHEVLRGGQDEGKLVIYGVGNPTLYNPVRDAFMARFPGIALEGVDQRGRESRRRSLPSSSRAATSSTW